MKPPIRVRIAELKKHLERVKGVRKELQSAELHIQEQLDYFEALQADANDAMRAHLMNGEESDFEDEDSKTQRSIVQPSKAEPSLAEPSIVERSGAVPSKGSKT